MQNTLRDSGRQPFEPAAFRRAFLAADYQQCRALIAQSRPSTAAALAASRVALREQRFSDALAMLTLATPAKSEEKLERSILLAHALGSTNDASGARGQIELALKSSHDASEALLADALYCRAFIAWIERDLDRAEQLATSILDRFQDANDRARTHILLSWIYARRRDLHLQAEYLEKALDDLETASEPDEYYRASALYTLALLCREIRSDEAAQRVRRTYGQLPWTDGLTLQRFQTTRLLAWIEALDGDELSAFRLFKTAAGLAPSRHWKVICLLDRAVLARSTGETAFAQDQLYEAHEIADSVSWNETQGEERAALILMAELFANVDAARAQHYLAQFRTLSNQVTPALAYGTDERVRAFARYSEGLALLSLSERDAAIQALEEAYDIFATHGYHWRSSLCALGLLKATGKRSWLKKAQELIAAWPKSWIADEIAQISATAAPPKVPPAQQAVLNLVLQGKRNLDIASELKRSPHTIRNQIADLFKTFDVKSRTALVAKIGVQAQQAGAA